MDGTGTTYEYTSNRHLNSYILPQDIAIQNHCDGVGSKHLVAEFQSPEMLRIARSMLERTIYPSDNTKVWGALDTFGECC